MEPEKHEPRLHWTDPAILLSSLSGMAFRTDYRFIPGAEHLSNASFAVAGLAGAIAVGQCFTNRFNADSEQK